LREPYDRDPLSEADTVIIPAVGAPRPGRPAFGGERPPLSEADTVTLPAVVDEPAGPSLGKASGLMMVATVISKITGMARLLVIAWVLGLAAVGDAYNAANTLPNQIYELFVGGVLTTVLVPVLVRARKDDRDGGEAYTQRLLTMATVALVVVTVLAVVSAPLLIQLVVNDSTGRADPALATALAYLLLPQILFYGLSALYSAVLNAKNIFAVTAWAPVLNNVVALATFGAYALLPGEITLNPVRMDTAHLLVLGIGSTLGVAVQSFVLIPPLLRSGFRFRMRWGWDRRFTEFGTLMGWTLAYVGVSQIGVVVVSNVATAHVGYTIYTTVWQLMHMPYAVIGYSLITAILPRMSSAAAEQRTSDVVDDLSLANRLCSVTMLPLSALLTVLGTPIGIALFSLGRGAADADRLGITLAVAAFGVLPYAVTLIQFRVFYAMNDARTPTMIMLIMTAVKIGVSLLAPVVLSSDHVVYGLNFADSAMCVVGWVAGEVWLRAKLGPLASRRLLRTLGKTLVASVAAGAAAWAVQWLVSSVLASPMLAAWLSMVVGGLVGAGVALLVLLLLKTEELRAVAGRFGRVLRPQ
jgi:putative peptidoglycan lipid II flippase